MRQCSEVTVQVAFSPRVRVGKVSGMAEGMLVIVGTIFSAFCLWLVVRIFNRRERWAKRLGLATLIVGLLGYPLSFGPACWISSHTDHGIDFVNSTFQPMLRIWWRGPTPIRHSVQWYALLFANDHWTIASSPGWEGYRWGEFYPLCYEGAIEDESNDEEDERP